MTCLDSRKKALLAHLGVGTIDQVLMAALPLYHQSLRILGLQDSVLIIDEVHACDTYVLTILEQVLRFQASLGGSAILLSATLPRSQRQKLCLAFAKGLSPTCSPPNLISQDYPLVTYLNTEGVVRETHVAARADVSRSIQVESIYSWTEISDKIKYALQAGQCVCWIRNTVSDALEGFRLCQSLTENVRLFHSRFTVADRARLERDIITRFGPDSTPDLRRGQILVATQVVEQSLDLDFDLLITDLAPIDLIVQRAGRLRRHVRDTTGKRLEGKGKCDERGVPNLLVHMPRLDTPLKPSWFKDFSKGGAFVYPNHGQLWLTAKWLTDQGFLRLPQDSRAMLEAVYGEDVSVPEVLIKISDKAKAQAYAERNQALYNHLEIHKGYGDYSPLWESDARTPTRLGESSITLRLVCEREGKLVPFYQSSNKKLDFRAAWELSQVRVPVRLIDSESGDQRIEKIKKKYVQSR